MSFAVIHHSDVLPPAWLWEISDSWLCLLQYQNDHLRDALVPLLFFGLFLRAEVYFFLQILVLCTIFVPSLRNLTVPLSLARFSTTCASQSFPFLLRTVTCWLLLFSSMTYTMWNFDTATPHNLNLCEQLSCLPTLSHGHGVDHSWWWFGWCLGGWQLVRNTSNYEMCPSNKLDLLILCSGRLLSRTANQSLVLCMRHVLCMCGLGTC